MIGTLAVFVCLASTPEFAVDVFLVSENGSVIKNLDWLQNPVKDGVIERQLRPVLESHIKEKKSFVILDGGDISGSPVKGKFRSVNYILRGYGSYDSVTETKITNGKAKKEVLETAETEETFTGETLANPFGFAKYGAMSFMHFDLHADKKISLAVQDLNSYQLSTTAGTKDDKEWLDKTLLVSADSILTTKQVIEDYKLKFAGVGICASGLADKSAPNLVSFPTAGKVAQYVLFRENGNWKIRAKK